MAKEDPQEKPATTVKVSNEALISAAILCLMVGFIWLFGGLLFGGSDEAPRTPTVAASPPGPTEVADNFLGHLRMEYWHAAHGLLSSRLKKEIDLAQFTEQVRDHLSDASHRSDLRDRTPRPDPDAAEPGGTPYKVQIVTSGEEPNVWEWTFVQEDEEWRLDDLGKTLGFGTRSSR